MTDAEMWALVVGFILPPVVSIIQRSNWQEYMKTIVAFLCCLIAAAGNIYVMGETDEKRMVTVVLLTFVSAISTYQSFWKPSGISPYIEKNING